jgi:hypothetical protein
MLAKAPSCRTGTVTWQLICRLGHPFSPSDPKPSRIPCESREHSRPLKRKKQCHCGKPGNPCCGTTLDHGKFLLPPAVDEGFGPPQACLQSLRTLVVQHTCSMQPVKFLFGLFPNDLSPISARKQLYYACTSSSHNQTLHLPFYHPIDDDEQTGQMQPATKDRSRIGWSPSTGSAPPLACWLASELRTSR